MRCKEVIRRINNSIEPDQEMQGHREILEHINSCPSCAQALEAARILNDALKSEQEKSLETTPFPEIRNRIIQNAAEKKKESIMSIMKNQINRRSGLVTGVSLAVIVFLFITLVPFSYTHIVGYRVTFAGSDSGVAVSSEQLSGAISALGYEDVSISETSNGCTIANLSGKKAAQDIAAALTVLIGFDGKASIEPVRETVSGSLYAQVKEKINIDMEIDAAGKSDVEIEAEIRQKLADNGFPDAEVSVVSGPEGECKIDISVGSDDQTQDKEIRMKLCIKDGEETMPSPLCLPGGMDELDIDTEGKTADEIRAEILARLASQGITDAEVEITEHDDGQFEIKVMVKKEETPGE